MAIRLGAHLLGLTDTLRFEPVARRVRARLDGKVVLDSTDAVLVWEPRRVVPMYAVPPGDLRARLTPGDARPVPDDLPPILGPVNFGLHLTPGQSHDLEIDGHAFPAAAFVPDDPDLGGRVVVEWGPFEWFEEAQPVTGHPHDPFKRIDVLASDRHLVVGLAGETLADTRRAAAVHETNLPVRWYVPHDDVRTDLLVGSRTTSICAYKGRASYVSVPPGALPGLPDGAPDIAWTYPHPLPEVAAVRGMFCFYAHLSDLTLDGVRQPRPENPWASPGDQERF